MTDRAEKMEAIYAQVPSIPDCKGHCWISCGPASMTPWERRRLAGAGYRVTPDEIARKFPGEFWCEALGPDGRCRAYELRPLICHLWGTVGWLPCPHGCMPEGGWLPDETAFRLIYQSMQLGGIRAPITAEDFEKLNDPAEVAAMRRELEGRDDSDFARFRKYGTALPVAITSRPK